MKKEHVNPYLLHNLKCKIVTDLSEDFSYEDWNGKSKDYEVGAIWELAAINTNTKLYIPIGEGDFHDFVFFKGSTYISISSGLLPVLHPLSEYAGNITGGEVSKKLQCSLSIVHEIWSLEDGEKHLYEITHGCMSVMNRNLIDYKKLIKKGEAIDINTL